MTILLDKEQFQDTVGFPPKFRDRHVVQLVASLLSHAIEMEYWNSSASLVGCSRRNYANNSMIGQLRAATKSRRTSIARSWSTSR